MLHFGNRRANCKLKSYQTCDCMQVGSQHRLLVFVGRLTHQKGSDLLSAAAQRILSKHKDVQVLLL